MKFAIDFNHETNDELLEQIGAKEEHFEECSQYTIDILSFEDLDAILHILDSLTKDTYSAVISFDPPTVYLDNKA